MAMSELPRSIQLAARICGLDQILDDVAVGFHWDVLDRLEDGVYFVNCDRQIIYWSQGAERITGYLAEDVLGRGCHDELLRHVDQQGRPLCGDGCPLLSVILGGAPRGTDVYLQHRAGHRVPVRVYGAPIRDSTGRIIGAFETFSDTTSLLATLERVRELEAAAFLDGLTGIANRRYLEQELQSRFAELTRHRWRFGVIMADVDHFKRVNDAHGHVVGDEVLKAVARTLSLSCRPYDLVGRWGGEEFLTIVGPVDRETLERIAERTRMLVASSTVTIGDQLVRVTISAGMTLARDNDDPSSLVARADHLLYASKSAGRDRVSTDVPCLA